MSFFASSRLFPPIEIYNLLTTFTKDSYEQKINLLVGIYYSDDGKTWLPPAVETALKAIGNDLTLTKEYLDTFGLPCFSLLAMKLILGNDSPAITENRAFGTQSLSGAGALRLGAEYLASALGKSIFYCAEQTWHCHKLVFDKAGFKEPRYYRYWNPESRALDMEGLLEDLDNAPEGAVVVLQACAHNPTGCDPTKEQWIQIAQVIKKRKLLTFFDCAYQGFASGDLDRDAWAIRYFVEQGLELLCAQSFAKNFGLYNERIGNLTIVANSSEYAAAAKLEIGWNVRGMYLSPPAYGARIVSYVLNDQELFEEWKLNIKTMTSRIKKMRQSLRAELEALGTPGKWNHLTDQIGMFSYIGLTEAQCVHLVTKYHVYLLREGRLSISGLTPHNVKYMAKSVYDTIKDVPY